MPWTAKQLKLFRAAAHNPAIAKSSGIKQADAERMSHEGLKKSKGGFLKQGVNNPVTKHGMLQMPVAALGRYQGMAKGGATDAPPQKPTDLRTGKPIVENPYGIPDVTPGTPQTATLSGMVGSIDEEAARSGPTTNRSINAKGRARGGKVSKSFEGSAKDLAQDKKLAKKHGMSFKQWEASKMDVKHDTQESMKGLKRGGAAKRYCAGGGIEQRGKTRGRII